MVQITLLEVHLEDASFSAAAPFGGSAASEESATDTTDEGETADTTDEGETTDGTAKTTLDTVGSPPKRAVVAVATLVGVAVVAALAWYLRGGEEPDVDIETADDDSRPVGVTVSDE